MLQRTPLNEWHRSAGAKMVEFGGWDMPLHYGSQLDEHREVRRTLGLFDVSHMRVIDISGPEARTYLRTLLANDVARLERPGQALYTCMLNPQGGVIDDLIVYYLSEGRYRCVVNAATAPGDLAWMREQAQGRELRIRERDDVALIAVQGPQARARLLQQVDADSAQSLDRLRPFTALEQGDWFFSCSGYTGEDGFEVILPARQAQPFWQALVDAGARPCGLAARDSLRLEAGLCLSGQDMGPETSPLTSALGWTIAWEPAEREFIGRQALEAERAAGVDQRLVGLVLEERGMLRHGQTVVWEDGREGVITSGGYSPVLGCSIALARMPVPAGEQATVTLRGRVAPLRVVKPPFVRRGQAETR